MSVSSESSSSTMGSHSAREDDDEYTNDEYTNDEYTNDEFTDHDGLSDGDHRSEYFSQTEDDGADDDDDDDDDTFEDGSSHLEDEDGSSHLEDEDGSSHLEDDDVSTDEDDEDGSHLENEEDDEDFSVSVSVSVMNRHGRTVTDSGTIESDDEDEEEEADDETATEGRSTSTPPHSIASDATEEWAHTMKKKLHLKRSGNGNINTNTNINGHNTTNTTTNNNNNTAIPGSGSTVSAQPASSSSSSSPTTTTTTSKTIPRILANHQRVPGGAAAKLIGATKKRDEDDEDYQFVNDGDDALEVAAPQDELIQIRDKARAEFSVGPTENKRYHAPSSETNGNGNGSGSGNGNGSERSSMSRARSMSTDGSMILPRILDRSQVFHENPGAAIVSILTPAKQHSNAPAVESILTATSDLERTSNGLGLGLGRGHCSSPTSPGTPSSLLKRNNPEGQSPGPFARPSPTNNKSPRELMTIPSHHSRSSTSATAAVDDALDTLVNTGSSPLVQSLVTKKTERHLAAIQNRMKDPNPNLTELMEAIASPCPLNNNNNNNNNGDGNGNDNNNNNGDGNGNGNVVFDRHYMVRRKNACGALKVLVANVSHRINICWTVGVLPALSSVLEDCGPGDLEEAFPDRTVRVEYLEARRRAVSALVYLATPKDNKLPMFHCPRLVAALVRTIEQDDEEARRGCCAVLAHLSKSKENRLIMAQVPGLLDAVATVIEPKEISLLDAKQSRSRSRSRDHDDDNDNDDDDSLTTARSYRSDDYDDDTATEAPSRYRRRGYSREEDVEMSLSEKSPERVLSEENPAEASARYDEDPDLFVHGARQNVFACLGHLVKEKDNAFVLARHAYLVTTLISITLLQESSSQHYALKLLAQLSRHQSNSKVLVFKMKNLVPAVVFATHSDNPESRKHACYALQNFSQDKPCRQQLASIDNLLPAICRRIRSPKHPSERLAALHTLKNLTDEPANLIPMTNTPECFATLMQVAHAGDDSITELMQYLGCDALATLSHWFRSIATSGQRIGTMNGGVGVGGGGGVGGTNNNNNNNNGSSDASVSSFKTNSVSLTKDELFVPTLRVLTWEPWQ